MRTNLYRVGIVIGIGFLIILLALGRLQLVQRDKLVDHPKNRYVIAKQSNIIRGGIYDRQGKALAIWHEDGSRYYPLGAAGSHLIGYNSRNLGTAGSEDWFSEQLLGQDGTLQFKNFWQRLAGRPERGYNIQLTIDSGLQQLGYDLLRGKKGAIVALDPRNGEILALISSPGFELKNLGENWDTYTKDQSKPLFNRAISGTYPPGSVFKLLVGAAALEADPQNINRIFYCPGYIEVEGRRLTCPKVHEELSFQEGIAFSCNTVFTELALELGEDRIRKQTEKLGFDQKISIGIPIKTSSFGAAPMSLNALVESAIGQGQVLTTPFQMALVTAAIANNGLLVEPYLLKGRGLPEQDFVIFNKTSRTRVFKTGTAQALKEAMAATVAYGTGWQAQLGETDVAGKTGSAENPHGKAHAWFVGFAPVETPQLVVAVIVENGGSGGGQGAPIVREMLDYFLTGE